MNKQNLDYIFNPGSIAIAGVSNNLTRHSPARVFMESLIEFGFKGKVYPVNTTGDKVMGLKIYNSVADIPDRVDYVISAIPAQYTPQLVADCASKGVKVIHFFTAGFNEIEDTQGEKLQSEISRTARRNGIRIIGPNCMGIYCPSSGLTFGVETPEQGLPRQSGPLGVFSQSGGNSNYCINEGASKGIYFSKVISYGNASDLNETDFLEYLTHDPETKIIAAYLEGVKDGPRFSRALKKATKRKPVIIYKAGNTESGTRATSSHTSAMAGTNRIWEGFLRQAGAIQVYSIEELIDVASLLLNNFSPKGRNTAIIGMGGGATVKAADDCTNAGLNLPLLPLGIRRKLMEITQTEAGSIFGNPVDTWEFEKLPDITNTVAGYDQIDLIIFQMPFDSWPLIDTKFAIGPYLNALIKMKNAIPKPVAVVLHSHASKGALRLAAQEREKLLEAGFPVFSSFTNAARAIDKLLKRT